MEHSHTSISHRPSPTRHAVHSTSTRHITHTTHVAQTTSFRTIVPTSHHATPTTIHTSPSTQSTGWTYPTPTHVPKLSSAVFGLGLAAAFLIILLLVAGGILAFQRRKTRKNESPTAYVLKHYGSDDGSLSKRSMRATKTRTWYGKRIIHLTGDRQA